MGFVAVKFSSILKFHKVCAFLSFDKRGKFSKLSNIDRKDPPYNLPVIRLLLSTLDLFPVFAKLEVSPILDPPRAVQHEMAPYIGQMVGY